eukprot:TRINITY_DN872_c0_g1_i1.p1 TRINITY_DN872_c0_g1~~TRINITY_DN872_c0_g1_i1.p1  ORF type:complete len:388 (-),score=127.67 TRINITY_DN872_c0_g1_i1:21-1130(-)
MNASSYEDFPSSADGYTSTSYPAVCNGDQINPAVLADDNRPRIFLMGLKRSGKTSIQKVVFEKLSPHETLWLETTSEVRVKDIANTPFVKFQIWDFPGKFDFNDPANKHHDPEVLFRKCSAIVFVIDAQDEPYSEALTYLLRTASQAYRINPNLFFEVLIHKVDGDSYLHDDHKVDCQRDIQQQLQEELYDDGLELPLSYYLTSIYDHSIFEALSKIVQKLIPQHPFLENLLDSLIASCIIEKAFLFDVVSKIYLATDSTPVDMQTYQLCSDMIDVVVDVSCIYGMKDKNDTLAFDEESASVIRMSNGHVLYLREVNKYLALVCLMREDSFNKAGLVEYNINCFKQAISELFDARRRANPKQSKSKQRQ